MRAFVHRRGRYIAELDTTERSILAGVVGDAIKLLGATVSEQEQETEPAPSGPPRSAQDMLAELDQEVPEPTDPALARLFPSASPDDPELSAEFRRLTQRDLQDQKVQGLRMVWAALSLPGTKLTVDPDDAMTWAAALTDVRLILSSRLGIETDADAEEIYALSAAADASGSEDELRLAMASVYSAFTWLQESLVQVMLPTLGAPDTY